jgi:hypothetical protein
MQGDARPYWAFDIAGLGRVSPTWDASCNRSNIPWNSYRSAQLIIAMALLPAELKSSSAAVCNRGDGQPQRTPC